MSLPRTLAWWVLGIASVWLTLRLAVTPVGIVVLTVVVGGWLLTMAVIMFGAAVAAIVGTLMAWVIPTVLLPVSLPYSLYTWLRDRNA